MRMKKIVKRSQSSTGTKRPLSIIDISHRTRSSGHSQQNHSPYDRNINNDPLAVAYGSTSKYMREVGILELFKSRLEDLKSSEKSKKGVKIYKPAEELHDEVISLKSQIYSLKTENSFLKSKLRQWEKDVDKKQKTIDNMLDLGLSDRGVMNAKTQNHLNPNVRVNNLKRKISKLEEKYREKDRELVNLSRDLKSTNIEEMKITIGVLKNEITRLGKLLIAKHNDVDDGLKLDSFLNGKAKDKSGRSKNPENHIKKLTETILKIKKDKNNLMLENKTLKIEIQKSLEIRENMKKNFENLMKVKDNGGSNFNVTKTSQDATDREQNLTEENARLKHLIDSLKQDKEHYRTEFTKLKRHLEDNTDKFSTPRSEANLSRRESRASSAKQNEKPLNSSRRESKISTMRGDSKNGENFKEVELETVELLQSIIRNSIYSSRLFDPVNNTKSEENFMMSIEMIQTMIRNMNDKY